MSGDGTADPSVMADLCRSYGLDGPAVALDRLRDEVDASPWPCPTEQAHIAAEEIRKALGEGT